MGNKRLPKSFRAITLTALDYIRLAIGKAVPITGHGNSATDPQWPGGVPMVAVGWCYGHHNMIENSIMYQKLSQKIWGEGRGAFVLPP